MFPQNPETPAERNVRIATEQGALHAKAVVRNPEALRRADRRRPNAVCHRRRPSRSLGSAVTRLRDEAPRLAGLFDANGKLDHRGIDATRSTRAIRETDAPDIARPGADKAGNAFVPSPRPGSVDRGGRGRRFQSV